MKQLLSYLVVTSVLWGAAQTATAQSFDSVQLRHAAPGVDGGTVGLAAASTPKYLGSDERSTQLFPSISYQWANGWFAGLDNGIGYNFSRNPALHYGLRLTADLGRQSGDLVALRGMGDVDAKPELGGFVTYAPAEGLALTGSVRWGSGQNSNGAVVDLGAGYSVALARQWRLGTQLSATLADSQHMQSYFGVDALQAARSGYAVYTPDAGLRDARLGLSLTYVINPRIFVTAVVSGSALGEAAKNSPVARSSNANTVVLVLSHAF
ncbi:MipA/OmpV family protein [Acidovorax sp.]|uniref:MipA/OmpV family protein n=1 Tax=Acidovorax sp. TaxID=1872122 RepID=UPI002ACD4CCF|nr:MipA/OmpV family protein [Acidovorax sp.]MDZ7862233.1 MipA/OmpV family protein [Acidovorax sp.]